MADRQEAPPQSSKIDHLDAQLSQITHSKPHVSQSRVAAIAKHILSFQDSHSQIVGSIVGFLRRCPPQYIVSGLYIVDSTIRNSLSSSQSPNPANDPFIRLFYKELPTLTNKIVACPDKPKIKKLLDLWTNRRLFPPEFLAKAAEKWTAPLDTPSPPVPELVSPASPLVPELVAPVIALPHVPELTAPVIAFPTSISLFAPPVPAPVPVPHATELFAPAFPDPQNGAWDLALCDRLLCTNWRLTPVDRNSGTWLQVEGGGVGPNQLKVLSRTLFVSGISHHVSKSIIADIFSQYGNVESVMINHNKTNGFVKLRTRREANECKKSLEGYVVGPGTSLRLRWGCRFGLRSTFDYHQGVQLVDLDTQLDVFDRKNLMTGDAGGIRDGVLRGGLTIEEPDVDVNEIKQWKLVYPDIELGPGTAEQICTTAGRAKFDTRHPNGRAFTGRPPSDDHHRDYPNRPPRENVPWHAPPFDEQNRYTS